MIVDVIMPKMGESITEGTVLEWKKNVGDSIELDETLLEISTDKVDSEVPSPIAGQLLEILFQVNDVVEVGITIAKIGTEGESAGDVTIASETIEEENLEEESVVVKEESAEKEIKDVPSHIPTSLVKSGGRFYSPLVRSIAKAENISQEALDSIKGNGKNGRVNKQDMLTYLESLSSQPVATTLTHIPAAVKETLSSLSDRVEPMGRVRKKIAEHMIASQKTSSHVYSTSEVDITQMVNFRTKYKQLFLDKYNVKLTYTPMLIDACIKAIHEFSLMNASIEGENIIHHQNINMGVAVALPDNNLIVPVIKSSEERNFLGLTRATADLAKRARDNSLDLSDISGSTFTITNPGIFGSLFGMAIINQPNVGILSIGSIQKRPVVKETEYGDVIAIRHMMYLTLGYDHRIIDGAYGTKFLTRIVKNIENFTGYDIKI